MRHAITSTAAMWVAACLFASAATAQMDLSGFKMVEPSPELPGDRALSCTQLAAEMGEIMRKRGMQRGIASSKNKICASRKTLDAQAAERQKLSNAQMPALTTAAVVGGPAANAVFQKTQAEDAALEAKQRPGRDRALAGMGSGMGDMLGVMNDPRLMRLGMLAQEKSCAESMAPPKQPLPAANTDGCDGAAEQVDSTHTPPASSTPAVATPAGAADPFVQRGAAPATPAAPDPFAKR